MVGELTHDARTVLRMVLGQSQGPRVSTVSTYCLKYTVWMHDEILWVGVSPVDRGSQESPPSARGGSHTDPARKMGRDWLGTEGREGCTLRVEGLLLCHFH